MAGTGFAMSTTMALANTIVQTNSPDWMRGRVMSIYLTVFAGSTPIGAALAGFLSALWGAPVAVAAGGAVVAAAVLAMGGRVTRIQRARSSPFRSDPERFGHDPAACARLADMTIHFPGDSA